MFLFNRFKTFAAIGVACAFSASAFADTSDPGDNVPNCPSVTALRPPSANIQTVSNRTLGGGDIFDWYTIRLTQGTTYVISTTLGSSDFFFFGDTVLYLYANVGDALAGRFAAFNDDFIGLSSRIVYTAETTGTFLLRVSPFSNAASTFTYSLNYSSTGGTGGGGGGGSAGGSSAGITGTPVVVFDRPQATIMASNFENGVATVTGATERALGDVSTADTTTTDTTATDTTATDNTAAVDGGKDEATDTTGGSGAVETPAIVLVEFRYRDSTHPWSDWSTANGTDAYSFSFPLDGPGSIVVQVRATDASGMQGIPRMGMIQR